uniref:Protein kinase domain-containing protein n=1 Tax=Mycena chlorophos TaxID=658473 RepID=A0ABQ0LYW6_MYCCL|nr:predicted protein [Mycena chlorophos]
MYPSNVGVAIRGLDGLSEQDIWSQGGPPTIVPLVPTDRTRDPASYPPYLTTSLDMVELLKDALPSFFRCQPRIRILDLGCGRFAGETPCPKSHINDRFAAPEVIISRFAKQGADTLWDWRSDIWSLACTIYDIVSERTLFTTLTKMELPLKISAVCGGAPPKWASYFPNIAEKLREHDCGSADALWAEKTAEMQFQQSVEDTRRLVGLLRCMLRIEPDERPSTSELLRNPYFDDPS